ncbi:hypothetical protein ROZALSC1DRAFT_28675 [Rozella allomycis CSF55]|uniref:ABC-2 type transporter domain-containing protein n=1 Tax=Rozella allomycis (strain CSF55) TaxID=988480 RepID=A0A4P9YJJ4_ROZAC|nr:hypothetical protein ROZALSC1DRAFT_28675 [Rozella allomycis CSF55]
MKGKGISGGELRRLMIGCQVNSICKFNEIISGVDVLLLDEPTSGLDAVNSLKVMKILENLAKEGKAIIVTLHQPRIQILNLINNLMIMSKGRTVFFGKFKDAIDFYSENGLQVPLYENAADFFLDVLDTTNSDDHDIIVANKDDIELRGTAESIVQKRLVTSFQKRIKNVKTEQIEKLPALPPLLSNSSFSKFLILLERAFIFKLKDPSAVWTQLCFCTLIPLLIGSVFYQLDDTTASIRDIFSVLSFSVVLISYLPFDVVLLFPIEMATLKRESLSGMYSIATFYMARNIAEIPVHCICSCIASTIIYFMIGLPLDEYKFGVFQLFMMLMLLSSVSLYIAVGALCGKVQTCNIVANIAQVIFTLFNGFFGNVICVFEQVKLSGVPVYLRWIEYINPMAFSYKAILYSQFGGHLFKCAERDVVGGHCVVKVEGSEYLTEFGVEKEVSYSGMVVNMIVFICVVRLIGFICLAVRIKRQS